MYISQDLVQEIDAGGSTGTVGAGQTSGQEINGNALNNSVVVSLSWFWSQQHISVSLKKMIVILLFYNYYDYSISITRTLVLQEDTTNNRTITSVLL